MREQGETRQLVGEGSPCVAHRVWPCAFVSALSTHEEARADHRGLGHKGLLHVDLCLGDVLSQGVNLADLLEDEDLFLLVAINLEAC